MRLIDADALKKKTKAPDKNNFTVFVEEVLNGLIDKAPTVEPASPWHRVEDDPPDEKTDAIFYYEWTGISGTVYKETSIISLEELMALGCRPIAWMEKPEPPKEEA